MKRKIPSSFLFGVTIYTVTSVASFCKLKNLLNLAFVCISQVVDASQNEISFKMFGKDSHKKVWSLKKQIHSIPKTHVLKLLAPPTVNEPGKRGSARRSSVQVRMEYFFTEL